jgi:hypothetical protein
VQSIGRRSTWNALALPRTSQRMISI